MNKITYNLTLVAGNSTTFLGYIQGVNSELMRGWLGILILLSLFFIVFIAFMQSTGNTSKSLAGASFIAFGLAIMLKILGLIPNLALFITLIAAGACIGLIWKGQYG